MREPGIVNENLRHALAAFSHVRTWGRVIQGEGVSLAYAGVPYGLFNTALVTEPLPGRVDFAAVLEQADDFFQKRNVPWSVWFCDDLLTPEERRRARIQLATRGMKVVMEAPGMVADELAPPRNPLPPIECRKLATSEDRRDFARVMATAFHVPIDMSRDVYSGENLWENDMHGWIGYVNGSPVSSAVTVCGGGSIGLYAVATDPSFQRSGYGESLMRTAIAEASLRTGLPRTVLQSSAAGYPLYLRMGYRNVTRFFVFGK